MPESGSKRRGASTSNGSGVAQLSSPPELKELQHLTAERVAAFGGVEALAAAIGTDLELGLDADEGVPRLRAAYGSNELPAKQPRGFLKHLIESFEDATLLILIVSAAVSLSVGIFTDDENEKIQGVAILIAIVIVSGVTSVQNWSKDKEFASLSEIKADRPVIVVRDGKRARVSIKNVVTGDLVVVGVGDALPCDGVIVQGHHIQCDESDLTGESMPRRKGAHDPLLWGGCEVIEGDGLMLATCVGTHSEYGAIVKNLELEEPPATPLQDKLEVLAQQIGYLGMACGALTTIVLTAMWLRTVEDYATADYAQVLSFFIVGISVVVVAVPEGLPLAVTISLAFSMRKMLKDNNLVRDLKSCETMGSATTVLSDKTGTLTENRMTVVEGWFFGKYLEDTTALRHALGPSSLNRLSHAIMLNSTARVQWDGSKQSRPEYIGNKTEGALVWMLLRDAEVDPEDYSHDEEIVFRQSFSSEHKMMLTVTKSTTRQANGVEYNVYVKGAGEVVVGECSKIQHENGRQTPVSANERGNLIEQVDAMARRGHRTIAVAYKRLTLDELPSAVAAKLRGDATDEVEAVFEQLNSEGALMSDLVCISLIGILDPIRPEVPDAVDQCVRAGVRVVMVTGDNMLTAKTIARQCGIWQPGGAAISNTIMEGPHFRELLEPDRLRAARELKILARSSPRDKLLLVETLIGLGEVVAVTGDGTNDAPALKAAHVGLSMGLAGTEVAKEASDIIILDDNFRSIVLSIRWGRAIMENVRKFLLFQLTVNVVALAITFVVACLPAVAGAPRLPLTPVQLLWVNLIMDSMAALALATEPPAEQLLERRPEGKDSSLITTVMWKNLLGHALFQTVLLLWLTTSKSAVVWLGFDPQTEFAQRGHYTVIFNVFVWLQVFNMVNCRKVHDEFAILDRISSSYFLEAILTVIMAMQYVIVQLGGDITQTEPLTFAQWRVCILLGALSIPVGYVLKLVRINEHLSVETPSNYMANRTKNRSWQRQQSSLHDTEDAKPEAPESRTRRSSSSVATQRRRKVTAT